MTMWPRLRRDFRRLAEIKSWGTLRALFDAVVLDAGFQALIAHRSAHTLKRWGVPLLPALLRRWSIGACAIDIVPKADIGGGCYIPHGVGIVIGGTSVVGEDCTILQGVTLGEARFSTSDCPRIGNRVVLGAGAKVLGGIAVGDDSFIGANSVVLDDVPPGSVAVGAPAVPTL
ncbi:MAG: serine O-acetyltransferase EpsC [Thermoanaerobaculia bacterium]